MHSPSDAYRPMHAPVTYSRPCWHCHWFDHMARAGAVCLQPQGCGCQPQPAFGCCSWMREPGADDEPDQVGQAQAPKAHFRDAAATGDYVRRRKRLDKIWEQVRRANMPPGTRATMRGTSGMVEIIADSWCRPAELEAARVELDRLGVNAAIERGAL